MFIYMLLFSLLVSQIKSHGRVVSPLSRFNWDSTSNGCNVNWQNSYLYGLQCNNVCGNMAWTSYGNNLGEIDPRFENTGPIKATYKMGQTIEVSFIAQGHTGTFRFKLCKLMSLQSEMVNQNCLDQNLLEIKDLISEPAFSLKDKYTIYLGNTQRQFNATALVKLPDGLSCQNCVLQWEYIAYNTNCIYIDGSRAPIEYCMSQIYKNCIDMKIQQDLSQPNQFYKPNLFNSIFPKPLAHPPVFSSLEWPNMYLDSNGEMLRPSQPDLLAYKGTGLQCFVYKADSHWLPDPAYVKLCRENCMTPEKTCPSECHCRWFNWL